MVMWPHTSQKGASPIIPASARSIVSTGPACSNVADCTLEVATTCRFVCASLPWPLPFTYPLALPFGMGATGATVGDGATTGASALGLAGAAAAAAGSAFQLGKSEPGASYPPESCAGSS